MTSGKSHMVGVTRPDRVAFCDGKYDVTSAFSYPLHTQALHYGTGIFEGIRAHWDELTAELYLFRPYDHFNRFLSSAKALRFELPYSASDLVNITVEVIRRNQFRENVYVRPLFIKKELNPGVKFGVRLTGLAESLSISVLPMGHYGAPDNSYSCDISTWRRTNADAIPSVAKITGGYVNSALAFQEACDQGFDDAILLNSSGFITEATTANVFIVKDRTLITPSVESGILNGITRQTVIELSARFGLTTIEKDVSVNDVADADECFLTATGLGIRGVSRVGDTVFKTGPDSVFANMKREYENVVRARSEALNYWCVPVYAR